MDEGDEVDEMARRGGACWPEDEGEGWICAVCGAFVMEFVDGAPDVPVCGDCRRELEGALALCTSADRRDAEGVK